MAKLTLDRSCAGFKVDSKETMNLILLYPDDFQAPNRVRVGGERAGHIRDVLRSEVGQTLRVGVIDGDVGEGTIVRMDASTVELALRLTETAPVPMPVSLIVGLPRPQTLKKVLEAVGTFGIQKLVLTDAGRVQKSYFSSRLLQDQAWRKHLLLGMSQGSRTRLPEVFVMPSLQQAIDAVSEASARVVADPEAPASLWETSLAGLQSPKSTVVSIGSEGGWLPDEIVIFREAGFVPFRLGRTIHRVENAVVAALAQIELFLLKA